MKNILLVALAILTLFSCRKDVDEITVTTVEDPIEVFVYSSLRGKVIDEAGLPVANAEVSFVNGTKYTDVNGNFYFEKRKVKKAGSSVKAVSSDYFTGVKSTIFAAEGSSYVEIKLINKGTPQILPSTGGTYTDADDMKITLPPNGVVDANGDVYTGDVKVYSRWLDPTDENLAALMPGDLTSKDAEGNPLSLTSYGIFALTMEGENGEALDIASGKTMMADLPIPPDLLNTAPDDIGLWYYDLEEEQWLNSGACANVSGYYHCSFGATGYYNCGQSLPGICLSGRVFNSDSTESAYLKVVVEDLTDNYVYWGYTDSLGYFCGAVPQAALLRLTLRDHCDNVVYTADLGPYASNFTLEDIYLDVVVEEYLINIQGAFENCTSTDIPDGHIAVWYPGRLRILPYTGGAFNDFIALNCVSFPEMKIKVYTNDEEKSSVEVIHNNFSDIDLGMLTMCEDLTDYFHLDVGGTNYWASPSQFYLKPNTTTPWMILQAFTSTGMFEIELRDYSGIGTYNVNTFFNTSTESTVPYPILTSASPDITVNITSDDGTYIEGTIMGSAIDEFNVSQNISGDFKILVKP